MRIFFVLFLFGLASIAYSQTPKKFTIRAEGKPLVSLFQEIETKSEFRFYYLNRWIDSTRVTGDFVEKSLPEILSELLKNSKIQFFLDDKRVILTYNKSIISKVDLLNVQPTGGTTNDRFQFQKEVEPEVEPKKKNENQIVEIGRKQANQKGNATLTGYVRDKKSNEVVIGATIYLPKLLIGTTTNSAGFYSISLPLGEYYVEVKYLGMVPETKQLVLHATGKLDFLLSEDVVSLKEVVVKADADVNVSSLQIGKTTLDIKSLKNVPKVLGENDILRVALMLPGVKSVGEGASGLNVRGGNADQNLMILNEATIYNSSHFLGFFSVFNADAIKSSELYKSGIPAQYGGRLSSIFDVQLKEGNQKQFSGYGGLGPVSARLNFEVPIVKEKTSLTFGGRTTYSDWLLKQIPKSMLSNSSASFYDISAKLTHNFNENNSLAASVYYSYDKFQIGNDSVISYSNALYSLQWRNRFGKNLHSQLNLTHSNYNYNINYKRIPQGAFNLGFGIKEYNLKWDFNYYANKQKWDFGFQSKLYEVEPGFINPEGVSSIVGARRVNQERGLENAFYIANNIDINSRLSLYLGLRFSHFATLGPGRFYSYQPGLPRDNTTIRDTVYYSNNQVVRNYFGPEYRVSLRYLLPAQSSIKLSYNRTRQYLHMLTNTVSVAPTTTWKISDPNILPQLGDQIAGGFYKNIFNNVIEASFEIYYKWMNNVLDYKIGSDLILNNQVEQDVLQGSGKAYGAEFLLRKRNGKLNGWLSYTYSRTFLKMDGISPAERINNGSYYPANYDKPHDVSLVANYKFTRRYSISFNFVYSTGRPITYPVGQYQFGGGYKLNYSDRNEFRIPDYVRLDVGINIEGNHKLKALAHGYWNFSIYNLLGRRNPYSVYFTSEQGDIKGYQLSIFGAPIPTITYNFKF